MFRYAPFAMASICGGYVSTHLEQQGGHQYRITTIFFYLKAPLEANMSMCLDKGRKLEKVQVARCFHNLTPPQETGDHAESGSCGGHGVG